MGIGSRQLALRRAGSRLARDDAPSAEGRALIAAFLSLLAPGTGQLLLGRRRRGLMMLGASLAVVAGGVGVWRMDPLSMLALLARPAVLLALLVANLVLFGFRGFAVVDAYRLGRGGAGGAVRRSARRS